MEQKDKELLLKDLCARLPFDVWVKDTESGHYGWMYKIGQNYVHFVSDLNANSIDAYIGHVKPYLRPLSSMIEEEKEEYCNLQDKFLCSSQYPVTDAYELFDWLGKHHFDYCGLIEKGLALEAPEGMYGVKHNKQ